jgi:hypothetical protein
MAAFRRSINRRPASVFVSSRVIPETLDRSTDTRLFNQSTALQRKAMYSLGRMPALDELVGVAAGWGGGSGHVFLH